MTCSTLPPSHAFQFLVTVTMTAIARSTIRMGVRYFSHLGVLLAAACPASCGVSAGDAGLGGGTGAAVDGGEADMSGLLYSVGHHLSLLTIAEYCTRIHHCCKAALSLPGSTCH